MYLFIAVNIWSSRPIEFILRFSTYMYIPQVCVFSQFMFFFCSSSTVCIAIYVHVCQALRFQKFLLDQCTFLEFTSFASARSWQVTVVTAIQWTCYRVHPTFCLSYVVSHTPIPQIPIPLYLLYMYMYTCTFTCVAVTACKCICTYTFACMYMHVHMCLCACLCMCSYMYIHVHIYCSFKLQCLPFFNSQFLQLCLHKPDRLIAAGDFLAGLPIVWSVGGGLYMYAIQCNAARFVCVCSTQKARHVACTCTFVGKG